MKLSPVIQGRRMVVSVVDLFRHTPFAFQVMGATLLFLASVSYAVYQAFEQQYQQVAEIFQVVNPELKHELVFNDIVQRSLSFAALAVMAYIVTLVTLMVRVRYRYSVFLDAARIFMEGLGRGDYTYRMATRKGQEMQELARALNDLAEQLEKRHGALVQQTGPGRNSVS